MKKILPFILFLLISLPTIGQTAKVYISDSITGRDGKLFYIHKVTMGQTIYSISKEYDVTLDEMYFENPGTKEGISVNQYLWIPTVNKETELNKEVRARNFDYFYHVVKIGESFNLLAKHYQVPVSNILKANPDIHEPLREGEYIKIPVDQSFDINSGGEGKVQFDPELPIIPDYRHTVSKGETLYSIAKSYHVTVDQVRMVNPGLASSLEIGDRIRIPQPNIAEATKVDKPEKKQEVDKQDSDYNKHSVKKKETLFSISRIYGVTVQDLYEANAGLTSRLAVGQIIWVPNKVIDKPYIVYTAERKTKLSKIAKLYNIPVSKISKENPSLGSRVLPGQKVRIPVGNKANVVSEKPDIKEINVIEEKVVVESRPVRTGCAKIKPESNKVYKIALMIPFYLEELDSLEVDQFMQAHQNDFMPFRFIRFYEGALIAIDSLRKQGYNIDLFVYDIDQSITKAAKVLQNPELKNMDLIIGPFQNKSFDQVAMFAGNFDIPIVNPFTFREEIVQKYKSAIKVKSAPIYQNELLPPLLKSDYTDSQVFLISHTAYTNAEEVRDLQARLTGVVNPEYKVPNTDLHNLAVAVAYRDEEFEGNTPLPNYTFEGKKIEPEMLTMMPEDSTTFYSPLITINYMKDSLHPFFKNASPLRPNLAIIHGESKAFAMDVMNRLNEHRDTFDIQVIGMPTFERFRNIDHIQANNMNLTYFSTNFIDYDQAAILDFILEFRGRYKTDPGIYGFSGFDITYYFVESLVNLDYRLRSCFKEHPMDMLLNKYDLKNIPGTRNFENSYWNLVRYQNYQLIKLPDPIPEQEITE